MSDNEEIGRKASRRTSVLIVEDEPAAREACEHYLGSAGFDVRSAENAADALIVAEQHCPDVLVCDWKLRSGPDGASVARDLQRRYDVQVIFVTAHPIDQLRRASVDIAVARYIRKPVELSLLAHAINDAIE